MIKLKKGASCTGIKMSFVATLFIALGVLFSSFQSAKNRSIDVTVPSLIKGDSKSKVAIDDLAFTWEKGYKLTLSKYPSFEDGIAEKDVYFKQATLISDGDDKTVTFTGGGELDNTEEYPENYAYAVYSQNEVKTDSFIFWLPGKKNERLFYQLKTPIKQNHQYLDAELNIDPKSIGKYAMLYGTTTELWSNAAEQAKMNLNMNHLMSFVDFTIDGLCDTVKVDNINLSSDLNFCSFVWFQANPEYIDKAQLVADHKKEDRSKAIVVNLLASDGTPGVYPHDGKLNVRIALRFLTHEDQPMWTMRLYDANQKLLYTGEKKITESCKPGYLYNKSINVTAPASMVQNDIKIKIVSGKASSESAKAPIEFSFDGDVNTTYHSLAMKKDPDLFITPIDLKYYFKNEGEDIDYMVYHPRIKGFIGNFEDIEVYATTTENPTLTKVASALFSSGGASRVRFNTTLKGATCVMIKVLSGAGNNKKQTGAATCSEMEFYKFDPNTFKPSSLFTDETCSALKNDITLDDIDACTDAFYKGIATKMFNNTYDREFRIQEYKAWMDPVTDMRKNKSNKPHSEMDNPTGIVAVQGEELIVFVGDMPEYNLRIQIQNLDRPSGDGYGWGSAYPITKGVNKIIPKNDGLIYVMYHSDTPEALKPIKIHFATGKVNGYYDSQKHTAPDDWKRLLDAATYKHFDVLGKYSHLTYETQQFRDDTPDGKELMGVYDSIAYEQQLCMGLVKYERMFGNRFYLHVVYKSFMYVASYRTAYQNTVIASRGLCIPSKLREHQWGVAHEIGHANQTIGWPGVGEVTNNILSAHVKHAFTGTGLGDKTYDKAVMLLATDPDMAFQEMSAVDKNFWSQLVPFWQLYLYFLKVEGQTDFYKDLYEDWRTTPEPTIAGEILLNFLRKTCAISGYDMTEFFEYWRFLTPMDTEIKGVQITQQQIDALKEEIAGKGYKTPQADVWLIRDSNLSKYQIRK